MRYEILIVLTILMMLHLIRIIRNETLQKGIRFCEKAENLLKAYEKTFNVKICSISYKYNVRKQHYRIVYDPKNPKSFFMQMELGIADALDEYDKIKENEFDYVEEDWDCILEHYEALETLSRKIKYETWRCSFRKV